MRAFDLLTGISGLQAFQRPAAVTGLPWQEPRTPLTQFVIDDIFGDMVDLVDRDNALKVAPVARARALLVGSISDLPLVAYRRSDALKTQPPWLYRGTDISPWHRMAYTIEDLLLYDCSLWYRTNNADGSIFETWRIPMENWEMDSDRRLVLIRPNGDREYLDADNVIYIPGPGTALLTSAADTIRGARAMDRAWSARVRTPIPPTLFKATDGTAEEEDVKTLLKTWGAARRNPESAGVGFVPSGLEAIFAAPNDDAQMFIEGRNGVRLDIANFTNIPASLLDGSTATASLTYVTAEGQRSSFHEQTMRYWTAPIEHRLSMDDVCPAGQRVRFDISYTTQVAPDGEPSED